MNHLPLKIAPSILSADFGRLNEEIAFLDPFVDLIHIDVMDGHFVPNITMGAPILRCLRSKNVFDVHLMIAEPEKYLEDFVNAGAGIITIHAEVCENLPELIKRIKSFGVRAGVSLKPNTAVTVLNPVLDELDMVLVMTVEPGFGGQKFMPEMLEKVVYCRQKRADLDIEVDGGINAETARLAMSAGANVLVAGNYIFASNDRKGAVAALRS